RSPMRLAPPGRTAWRRAGSIVWILGLAGLSPIPSLAGVAAGPVVAPSSVRIRELLTDCNDLQGPQSYIELTAVSPGETRDSTLRLEIRDASDSLTAVVPAGFGSRSGEGWPVAGHWLFATPGITNVLGSVGDVMLPVPLDQHGGR